MESSKKIKEAKTWRSDGINEMIMDIGYNVAVSVE